jgi:hypothetical protein
MDALSQNNVPITTYMELRKHEFLEANLSSIKSMYDTNWKHDFLGETLCQCHNIYETYQKQRSFETQKNMLAPKDWVLICLYRKT